MVVPAYPEQSQASTTLVLGILGIVCCPFLGIAAWVMGTKELEAITSGRRDPANLSTAKAGRILGIIGTVLTLGYGAILVIAAIGAVISGSLENFP